MIHRLNRSRTSPRRRAVLLICVLVCLTMVMMLFAATIRLISLERQQVRAQGNRLQAEYLADSGLERATALLAGNPEYVGETWRIDTEQLGMRDSGTVSIRVEAIAEKPQSRRVIVVADFPAESEQRSRRSKQIQVDLPQRGDPS